MVKENDTFREELSKLKANIELAKKESEQAGSTKENILSFDSFSELQERKARRDNRPNFTKKEENDLLKVKEDEFLKTKEEALTPKKEIVKPNVDFGEVAFVKERVIEKQKSKENVIKEDLSPIESSSGSSSTSFNSIEQDPVESPLVETLIPPLVDEIDTAIRVGIETLDRSLRNRGVILERTEIMTQRWANIRIRFIEYLNSIENPGRIARYLGSGLAVGALGYYILRYQQLPNFGSLFRMFNGVSNPIGETVRTTNISFTLPSTQSIPQAIPTSTFLETLPSQVPTSFLLVGGCVLAILKFLKK